jgi:hypothetical protein
MAVQDPTYLGKVKLWCCADGTVTVTGPGEAKPIPQALPLFSTNRRTEAERLRLAICQEPGDGPLAGRLVVATRLRGPHGFDGTPEGLFRLTELVRAEYERLLRGGR